MRTSSEILRNREAIFHEPTPLAHAISDTQIQVRLQNEKNDMTLIEVLFADVYNWASVEGEYRWQSTTVALTKRFSDEASDYYVATLTVSSRFNMPLFLTRLYLSGQLGTVEGPFTDNHVHNYFTFHINKPDQPPSTILDQWTHVVSNLVDRFASTKPKLDWPTSSVMNQNDLWWELQGIIEN